jgi:hypothetical protein
MVVLTNDRFLQELFRQFHSSVRRTLAFEAEVQTKLNLRLTDLEKRVSKVQNSQGVHGQILRMSAKELGILRSELESSRHDSTHELQQACGSFWRAMVNEMEDIRNGVINEMKDILPRTGNDLRDEIVGSDEVYCAMHVYLRVLMTCSCSPQIVLFCLLGLQPVSNYIMEFTLFTDTASCRT